MRSSLVTIQNSEAGSLSLPKIMSVQTVPLDSFPRHELCDIWLNALSVDDIRNILRAKLSEDRKFILANQNLHSLFLCTQDEKSRQFFDLAEYTHIDGTSLIALAKLGGLPFELKHRSGYMDLFPELLPTIVENGWRVFYVGSSAATLQAGLERLRQDYPGLVIEGYHGYFNKQRGSSESAEVVSKINAFRPDLLFIGMGMPIQEHWILDNFAEFDTKAIFHCGGLLEYIAGTMSTPPRWLGPIGLEWFYRLCTEPRRLWRRYLVEPVVLLPAIVRWLWRVRVQRVRR